MKVEKVRMLVIDDDDLVRNDLKEIFEPEGYEVQAAQGVGSTLMANAQALAQEFRPHVAIVDLNLLDGTSNNLDGLDVVTSLKSAKCILYSAYLTPEVSVDSVQKYGAASAVGKQEHPERLVRVVNEAAHLSAYSRGSMAIVWEENLDSEKMLMPLFVKASHKKTKKPAVSEATMMMLSSVVQDLLYQIFHEHHQITIKRLERATGQTTSTRRHSIVIQVEPDNFVPMVVKLAPVDQLEQEIKHYNDHVRNRLGGLFYAHLEKGPIMFWDLGGAVYSLLGAARAAFIAR